MLAGSYLECVDSTKYSGVQVYCRDFNPGTSDKTLAAAKCRVNEIRGIGLLGKVHLKRAT